MREHADRAQSQWLRVKANRELGAYEAIQAGENPGEPEWPTLGFWELIKIAFKDYLITSLDHPVVRRLRGLA